MLRQVIIRARNLRASANFIPAKSFRARRFYYSNEVRVPAYFCVFGLFIVVKCLQQVLVNSGVDERE